MATSSRQAMISMRGAIPLNGPCARSWSEAGGCSRAIPPPRSRSLPKKTKRCGFSRPWRPQQGTRMQHLGLNFILNDETCAAFYRNLVRENAANGYAVLSALTVGEEVVATLLGI